MLKMLMMMLLLQQAPGYPFFFIAGISIEPNAATSATAEPEISAKNMEVAILIILKPPLMNPTSAEANAINLLEIPALFIIEPARINSGIAINGNFIDPSNKTIAVSIKKLVPVFKTIATIVVTARPIAIGTFIERRKSRTANIVNIIIKYLLFAQHLMFAKLNFYNLLVFLKFQIK